MAEFISDSAEIENENIQNVENAYYNEEDLQRNSESLQQTVSEMEEDFQEEIDEEKYQKLLKHYGQSQKEIAECPNCKAKHAIYSAGVIKEDSEVKWFEEDEDFEECDTCGWSLQCEEQTEENLLRSVRLLAITHLILFSYLLLTYTLLNLLTRSIFAL